MEQQIEKILAWAEELRVCREKIVELEKEAERITAEFMWGTPAPAPSQTLTSMLLTALQQEPNSTPEQLARKLYGTSSRHNQDKLRSLLWQARHRAAYNTTAAVG